MKYLRTLALLLPLSAITTLVSCSEGFEDFPADTFSIEDTKDANGTKSSESNDASGAGIITIEIDDPEVQDIDYTITIP